MHAPIPAEVADAYALAGVEALYEFESYGNANWLIESHGARYVLRQHRLNADRARIELQLALQDHLVARGVPAPPIVATQDGGRWAVDAGGAPWVLCSYINGADYDFPRRPQAVEAGRTLARFHLLTDSFSSDGPGPQYKATLDECWADPFDDIARLSELLDGRAGADVDALGGWWRTVHADWPWRRVAALPSGWVHGDFHGRNVVFRGDRIVGVFDFDDVDRGPYAYDVAMGLFRFGRQGRGSLVLRPSFAHAFLDGYESVRPISDEERAALPMLVAMLYPPHPRHYAYWRYERGEDIEERFRREVRAIGARHAEVLRIGSELFGQHGPAPGAIRDEA